MASMEKQGYVEQGKMGLQVLLMAQSAALAHSKFLPVKIKNPILIATSRKTRL